jgi:hypothetical protein
MHGNIFSADQPGARIETMHCGSGNSERESKVVLDILFKAGGPATKTRDNTPERFEEQTTRKGEDVLSHSKAWEPIWKEYLAGQSKPL